MDLTAKQVQEFKETEIGKIPVDWEVTELENVCVKVTDGSHSSPKQITSGNKRIASVKDIENDDFNFNSCKIISDEDFEQLERNGCKPIENDIIFSKDGTMGLTFVYKNIKDLVLLSSIAIIRPNSEINSYFLNFYLRNKKIQNFLISGHSSGSALPRIVLKDLKKLSVIVPKIGEQERIVKILYPLDTKISNLQKQNRTLEETAQTIFQSWFVNFDGVTEFEDSELGKIPKGWSVDILENVCSKVTDGSHFSPKEETNGVKMIGTVKNMNEYDFDFDSCKKISDEDYEKLVKNGCKAELGDVLLSKDGTMGLSMLYQSTIDLVLLSSIAIIKTNENFSNYYLKILLSQQNNLSVLIGGHSSGSALPRIVLKDLRTFQLLVPNNLALKKFDNIIQPLNTEIFSNSQKIKNLTQTRDTLLPKLMSGEIRV